MFYKFRNNIIFGTFLHLGSNLNFFSKPKTSIFMNRIEFSLSVWFHTHQKKLMKRNKL